MRGFSKRLKPMMTPTFVRAMKNCDPATGYALFMWYQEVYTRMTGALDGMDNPDASADELADALEDVETPPPPDGVDKGVADIVRGEAQDLIEGAIMTTMANRAKTRAARARKAASAAMHAAEAAEESAGLAKDLAADCYPCYGNSGNNGNTGNNGNGGDARSSPLKPPSSFDPRTSKKQSINARERASARGAPTSTSAWTNEYNLDGRDPVDLALEEIGRTHFKNKRDEERERACWGAHLRRLGPRRFCEALHVFRIDGQFTGFKNRAAALNAHLSAVPRPDGPSYQHDKLSVGEGGGTPRVGSCGPGPEGCLRTAGSRGARD